MSKFDPLDSLRGEDGAEILKSPEALKQLLSSQQAQSIAALLQQVGGERLGEAAEAAARGDGSQLNAILSRLSADPKGAKAMKDLEQKTAETVAPQGFD